MIVVTVLDARGGFFTLAASAVCSVVTGGGHIGNGDRRIRSHIADHAAHDCTTAAVATRSVLSTRHQSLDRSPLQAGVLHQVLRRS